MPLCGSGAPPPPLSVPGELPAGSSGEFAGWGTSLAWFGERGAVWAAPRPAVGARRGSRRAQRAAACCIRLCSRVCGKKLPSTADALGKGRGTHSCSDPLPRLAGTRCCLLPARASRCARRAPAGTRPQSPSVPRNTNAYPFTPPPPAHATGTDPELMEAIAGVLFSKDGLGLNIVRRAARARPCRLATHACTPCPYARTHVRMRMHTHMHTHMRMRMHTCTHARCSPSPSPNAAHPPTNGGHASGAPRAHFPMRVCTHGSAGTTSGAPTWRERTLASSGPAARCPAATDMTAATPQTPTGRRRPSSCARGA